MHPHSAPTPCSLEAPIPSCPCCPAAPSHQDVADHLSGLVVQVPPGLELCEELDALWGVTATLRVQLGVSWVYKSRTRVGSGCALLLAGSTVSHLVALNRLGHAFEVLGQRAHQPRVQLLAVLVKDHVVGVAAGGVW